MIALVAMGCTAQHNNTPKGIYKELTGKFQNIHNIRINYNINFSSGMNMKIPLEMDILDNQSKSTMEMSLFGETSIAAVYKIGNTSITCTESGNNYGKRNVDCVPSTYTSEGITIHSIIPKFNLSENNTYTLSLGKSKKIAGRDCYDFIFKLHPNFEIKQENIINGIPSHQNVTIEICLDKKNGAPLLMVIKKPFESKIMNKTAESELFRLQAENVSFDVNKKEFEIPYSYVLGRLSCNKNLISFHIIPLKEKNIMNFKWNCSTSNGTFFLENTTIGKKEFVSISTTLNPGVNHIEVCYNNECYTDNCYVEYYSPSVENSNVMGNKIKKEVAVPNTEGNNLIKNGDFSDGLTNWEKTHSSNVNDQWDASITSKDELHTNVLMFERTQSRRDGGAVYVNQYLNKDVSKYTNLTLKLSLKVLYHTLSGSGWGGGAGEYPVHIYVYYKDANDNEKVWSWGFLAMANSDSHKNYNIVNSNEWYSFESQNLMNLNPKPKIITKIVVGGNGWDFSGMIDNLALVY